MSLRSFWPGAAPPDPSQRLRPVRVLIGSELSVQAARREKNRGFPAGNTPRARCGEPSFHTAYVEARNETRTLGLLIGFSDEALRMRARVESRHS